MEKAEAIRKEKVVVTEVGDSESRVAHISQERADDYEEGEIIQPRIANLAAYVEIIC